MQNAYILLLFTKLETSELLHLDAGPGVGVSPFNCTRLVGRLLLIGLFIMFHTSSIMFRSGLLADQSST